MIGLMVLLEEDGYLRVGGEEGFHLGIEQGDPGPVSSLEICIRVPDVDTAYQRLAAAGIPVGVPPTDQPWGARHAWLTDPDGRRISIFH